MQHRQGDGGSHCFVSLGIGVQTVARVHAGSEDQGICGIARGFIEVDYSVENSACPNPLILRLSHLLAGGMALGVLGALGAMLAVTGIFGLGAYAVSKRLRELGIRVALGAQRKQVLHAALGRVFWLLAIGSTAGLLMGLATTRLLSYIVYQPHYLPHLIGSDFPAIGRPYRNLSIEELAILTSIAQERHKALNWLCGFSSSGRWADTTTDT